MSESATPARQFKPTREMIQTAENVYVALAIENHTRPIVEAYQRKVLGERKWLVDPDMRAEEGVEEYVTEIKYAWMMSKEDFAVYHRRCNEERVAAKLVVESDDYCPLLVAEDVTRQAKRALLEAVSPITKISGAAAAKLSMKHQAELVDLTLRLMAPYVKIDLKEWLKSAST